MIFSQTIEYGFRAMATLAIQHREGPVASAELAELTSIPPGYLSKIMRRMVVAGLVHSRRGHGGGFRLVRPPEEIRFIEVLDALDYALDQQRCAFGIGRCGEHDPCPLHEAWAALRAEFNEWALTHHLGQFPEGEGRLPPFSPAGPS